ncbi:MAG: DUF3566 domain-containing protein [Dermatophilaceae bacterium]
MKEVDQVAITPTPVPAVPTAPAHRPGGRRVRLTASRIDPWSAMKVSFLVSVGLGIAAVVMVTVLWMLLSGMGVFDQVNSMVNKIIGDTSTKFDLLDFVGFGRVVSLSVVFAVVNVLLMTAMATLAAFLYNICASLVGGIQMTLTDD